jgi:hypothetical protein
MTGQVTGGLCEDLWLLLYVLIDLVVLRSTFWLLVVREMLG